MPYTNLSRHPHARLPDPLVDVREFAVRTAAGDEPIGHVADLVCTTEGEIRYLDVRLRDVRRRGLGRSRHVAVPIGAARLDRDRDVVRIDGLTKEQLKQLPAFDADVHAIEGTFEARLHGVYGPSIPPEELYDVGRFLAERADAGRARAARVRWDDA